MKGEVSGCKSGGAQENEAFSDLGLCIAKLYFYFGRVAEFDCLFVRAKKAWQGISGGDTGTCRDQSVVYRNRQLQCFFAPALPAAANHAKRVRNPLRKAGGRKL